MPSEFADLPELVELQSGRSIVRVPNEQNVPLTRRVRALIDTAEFQRLNEISQLGLVAKVYPGARHTRFEHALGVYLNALRYLQQLSTRPRFREIVDVHSAELLIVASLLHDLGHWPFCHPIEDLEIPGLIPHEAHAARYLTADSEISEVLRNEWNIDPAEVLDILNPQSDSAKLRLLRSIISGPIDVDKMDYLDRDSWHCGVPYGRNFDRQRLIQSLTLNEQGDGLAITSKGKTAAELMVFARYVMFSEVYWHHAVRSATSMFARAFFELHPALDLPQLFGSTDAEMVSALRNSARGKAVAPLLESLFGTRRKLYKRAAEFSHDQDSPVYSLLAGRPCGKLIQTTDDLVDRINAEHHLNLTRLDIVIDAPPPHREVEFAVDVYLPKEDRYRPLREVSPVIDALATTQFDDWVKRVRIFVAPQWRKRVAAVNWESLLTAEAPNESP